MLFAAFSWQLFWGHEEWADFNSSDLLAFHVLSLCLTLWRGPRVVLDQQIHQWAALLVFRSATCAIDALVLARMSRASAVSRGVAAWIRTSLVVILTAASVYRWMALLASFRWARLSRELPDSAETAQLLHESQRGVYAGEMHSIWT